MSSVLIVTADPSAATVIEGVALELLCRVRSVGDLASAKEWLSMQLFDVLLVDARWGDSRVSELLDFGWKQNPLALGGVFNFTDTDVAANSARLQGAQMFVGPQGPAAIREMLRGLSALAPSPGELSVLLVDDLDAPREIVRSYIEMVGNVRVDTAKSVDEALTVLRKNERHYFCVVTDYNMPSKGGLQLIEEMRHDAQLSEIPIVVLTAYSTLDNLIDCLKAGATGFLVKPPKKKSLRFEIEKARRLFLAHQSPWVCKPEEAHLLEDAIQKYL